MTYPVMKRLFDIIFASCGLLVLSPLGVIVSLLIKLSDGGPVFFAQTRVGQFGRTFRILKFRTMVVDAEQNGLQVTKERDERITWIGRWLRKAKFDELPQLWNVLCGQMSFVGPRPEVPRYVAFYTPKQRRILDLRPGITDLATVLFRNEEALLRNVDDVEGFYIEHCLPKKLDLNFQYAKDANVFTDFALICQTLIPYWLAVVLLYSGILLASISVAYFVRFEGNIPRNEWPGLGWRVLTLTTVQMLFLLGRRGHAQGLLSYFGLWDIRNAAVELLGAAVVTTAIWFVTGGAMAPPRGVIFIDTFIAFGFIVLVRLFLRGVRHRYINKKSNETSQASTRLVIIGANPLAARFIQDLSLDGKTGYEIVAVFDDNPTSWHKRIHGIEVMGMPEQALSGEWSTRFDEAILALDDQSGRSQAIIQAFRNSKLRIRKLVAGLVEIEP